MTILKLIKIIAIVLLLTFCFNGVCTSDVLDIYFGNKTYNNSSFQDVSHTHWAAEAIYYLAGYGIVAGTDGLFYPDTQITRAQFVKILILAFGLYDKNADCNFYDVPKDSWFYPYVASAGSLGITTGITQTEFGADNPLQRQQMAVLIYNTAKYSGITFEDMTDISFIDNNSIEQYAYQAVGALFANGAITGDENNYFNPTDIATRAQACQIIYNIINKMFN